MDWILVSVKDIEKKEHQMVYSKYSELNDPAIYLNHGFTYFIYCTSHFL